MIPKVMWWMAPAGRQVSKRPAVRANRVRDPPHGDERDQEADVAKEQSLLATVAEVLAVEGSQHPRRGQRAGRPKVAHGRDHSGRPRASWPAPSTAAPVRGRAATD